MKSQKNLKTIIISVFSAFLVPSTSAAIGSGPSIEASLVEFMNRILIYQIEPASGAAGVLMYFVAPMVGFYFIQKNMLSYGFELFEERIDRNSYHRRDEDIPTGIKGLSIVTGFITVQTLGTLGAGILFATAALSIILGALMQFGLLQGLGGSGSSSSSSSGGNSNRNSNSNNPQPQQQSSNSSSSINWEQLGKGAANFVNGVGGSGSYGKSEEDKIKEAFQVFEHGDDPGGLLAFANNNVGTLKNNIKSFKRDRGFPTSRKDLGDIDDKAERVLTPLEQAVSMLEADKSQGNKAFNTGNSELCRFLENNQNTDNDMQDLLSKIDSHLERIDKNEASSNFKDDIDQIWDEIQTVTQVSLFIKRLPYSPQEIISDNAKLQNVYDNSPSHLSWGGGSANFESELSDWNQNQSHYQELFRELENVLEKDLTLEEKELKEVKKKLKEKGLWSKVKLQDAAVPQYLKKILNGLNWYDKSASGPKLGKWETNIQDMIQETEDIRDESERLRKEAKSGKRVEAELYEKVKEVEKALN